MAASPNAPARAISFIARGSLAHCHKRAAARRRHQAGRADLEERAGAAWDEEPGTNVLDSGAHFYEVYTAADGGCVAVGAIGNRAS